MGHREALLEGAKQCLRELGYAHTTARDIVKASGTNLSSIGYHFGTKEALLNAAMMDTFGDWASELEGAFTDKDDHGDTPFERFGSMIAAVIDSVQANPNMWSATVDAFRETEHSPELLARLAVAHEEARRGAAALIYQLDEKTLDDEAIRTVGSLYLTITSGLMLQWLTDPSKAPTAKELSAAIKALAPGPEQVP
jgi:AcrR family transcriptional regulator